ncbi:MAG: DUF4136 domain-containing protein [Pseudomonadales bacterium]
MSQRLRSFTLLTLLLFITACTSLKTGSECYIDEQTLSGYQTFSWISDDALTVFDETHYISPLMIEQIINGIQNGFEDAGYSAIESEDDADFLVSAVITTRQSHEDVIYFPARSPDALSSIERGDVHLKLKTSGFLAVDVYDGTTGAPLWRGWAERPLEISDRNNAKQVIRQAVTTIIAQFPAR